MNGTLKKSSKKKALLAIFFILCIIVCSCEEDFHYFYVVSIHTYRKYACILRQSNKRGKRSKYQYFLMDIYDLFNRWIPNSFLRINKANCYKILVSNMSYLSHLKVDLYSVVYSIYILKKSVDVRIWMLMQCALLTCIKKCVCVIH